MLLKPDVSIVDEENDLRELIDGVVIAKESASHFIDRMKRARERSQDARRSMQMDYPKPGLRSKENQRSDINIQSRIHVAEAELRELNDTLASFSKAGTLIDLEETSSSFTEKLASLSKRIRHLKSENIRREKELERVSKNTSDGHSKEETLKRELLSMRARNAQLETNLEAHESAYRICLEQEKKIRNQISSARGAPPASLTTRRRELINLIEAMNREKDDLTSRWKTITSRDNTKISVLERSLQALHVASPEVHCIDQESPKPPNPVERNDVRETFTTADVFVRPDPEDVEPGPIIPNITGPESVDLYTLPITEPSETHIEVTANQTLEEIAVSISVIEPMTALQSPHNHVLSEETILVPTGTGIAQAENGIQPAQLPENEYIEEPEAQPAEKSSITSNGFHFPEINESKADSVTLEVSEEYHPTDEAVPRDTEEHILPRRLFQSEAAREDDSHALGRRASSPAPPLIQIPRVFHVESRSGSIEDQ